MIFGELDEGQAAERTFGDLGFEAGWFWRSERVENFDVQFLNYGGEVSTVLKLGQDSLL